VTPSGPLFTARDRSGDLTAGRHLEARVPAGGKRPAADKPRGLSGEATEGSGANSGGTRRAVCARQPSSGATGQHTACRARRPRAGPAPGDRQRPQPARLLAVQPLREDAAMARELPSGPELARHGGIALEGQARGDEAGARDADGRDDLAPRVTDAWPRAPGRGAAAERARRVLSRRGRSARGVPARSGAAQETLERKASIVPRRLCLSRLESLSIFCRRRRKRRST